jgi:hypothetical protein
MSKPENGRVKRDFGYLFELQEVKDEMNDMKKRYAKLMARKEWLEEKIQKQ